MKFISKDILQKIIIFILFLLLIIALIDSVSVIISYEYFLGQKNILIKLHKLGQLDLMNEDVFYEWIKKNKELCFFFNEMIASNTRQIIYISLLSILVFVFILKNKWTVFFLLAIPLSFCIEIIAKKCSVDLPMEDNCINLDYLILNVFKLGKYMLLSSCILGFISLISIVIAIKYSIGKKTLKES